MYSWTSENQGQPLVEVFSVSFKQGDEPPAGTVSVFDGKRGQIIYSSDNPFPRTQRSGGLPLTGPYRAISADGSVAFVLDLSSSPTEIFLDVYDEATKYDQRLTSSDGRVVVTYALLSNAAEATVEVRLLGQHAGRTVGGTVVAQTDLGEVVLFDDADGASVCTGREEEQTGLVPLNRSIVAVPLASSLTVVVDLVVNPDDGRQDVVKGSVVSVPKLGSEDVQRRPAAGVAAVEVKVAWLD